MVPHASNLAAILFLSTPSARRATASRLVCSRLPSLFLSTPSARRATSEPSRRHPGCPISIHALCEEGDTTRPRTTTAMMIFLSTPSARRATAGRQSIHAGRAISIHALCEEGDADRRGCGLCSRDFYPRPLRGGRQQKQRQNLYFQTNYTTFCTNLEEP